MSELLKKNTLAFYLFNFFFNAVVFIPVYILFEQQRGLNLTQISLTVSIYYLAFFIFEVPTGFFADKYGRKISLILGAGLMMIAVVICVFARNFYHFALAELIFAIAVAFVSGADSALIYDTLWKFDRQDDYLRIEGKAHTVGRLAKVISFIACSVLAKYSLLYPYIATVGTMTAALLVSFAFSEKSAVIDKTVNRLSLIRLLKRIHQYDRLYAVFLYNALMFCMTRIGAIIIYQPYFTSLGMPKEQLGLLYAGLNVASAISASKVESLNRKMRLQHLIILLPIAFIVSLGVFIAGNLILSIIILVIPALAFGVASPVIKNLTNRAITDSSERATVLSVQSLTARTAFAALAPIAGLIMEKLGIFSALIVITLIFSLLVLLIIPKIRKNII